MPTFTSVQLVVPQYAGWPQHHFVCYVQGHLDLPPPACPAQRVPRYWGDRPDEYNYKNEVNDFDPEAMCVGGTHVRKYSFQEPPTIIESTTIRAVACTYGGSSAVATYAFFVVETPAAPRMLLHPPAWGNKPKSNANATTGFNNEEVAETLESSGSCLHQPI